MTLLHRKGYKFTRLCAIIFLGVIFTYSLNYFLSYNENNVSLMKFFKEQEANDYNVINADIKTNDLAPIENIRQNLLNEAQKAKIEGDLILKDSNNQKSKSNLNQFNNDHDHDNNVHNKAGWNKVNDESLLDTEKLIENNKLKRFFDQVFQNIMDFSPTGFTNKKYNDNCQLTGDIGIRDEFIDKFKLLSQDSLINCLEINETELVNLKESHAKFVESLAITLPSKTYKGSGIVMVGGGKFSMMAYLSIRHLREIGSTLPVEVFIPPNEIPEEKFCSDLLPKYNAKCININKILSSRMINKFSFKGYQFKSLALVASSFQNLLLLDADNFPIKNIDKIFDEEPYKSKGLVLWPDFWRRSTQPLYFDIAGTPIEKNKRVRYGIDDITPPEVYTEDLNKLSDVPLADLEGALPDMSTESGQLLINKKKHLGTALLSLYYNVNGPSWYYPIFTQRSAGEGDKETFIAAANFYGLPYYQVRTGTDVEGYHDHDGFHGVAMLQSDCTQDYEKYLTAKREIQLKYSKYMIGKEPIPFDPEYNIDAFINKYFKMRDNIDVMFVHSNIPKFDPFDLFYYNRMIYKDGSQKRAYSSLAKIDYFDIELTNYRIFTETLCSKEPDIYFPYINIGLKKVPGGKRKMCTYLNTRLKFLEETHEQISHQQ